MQQMDIEAFIKEREDVRPMLIDVARSIVGNAEEAEDVVQDVMERLWRMRDEPVRNPAGLARVMVRNASIDLVRRREPTVQLESLNALPSAPATENVDDDALLRTVFHLMSQLPDMQQTVFRLRHIEGMTMSGIAQLLGITEMAIRQSLSRARRSLLRKLNETNS